MPKSRLALRGIALVVAAMVLLVVASPAGGAPARQAQPAAGSTIYLPVLRTAPPLPTRLVASADVDVIQGLPTSNYGSDDAMWLGYHKANCTNGTISGKVSRNLIRFDLSAVPVGAVIGRAVLNIRVVGLCWYTRASGTVTAYRVAAPWQESTATWNAQPAAAEAAGSVAIPFNFNANAWYTLDVTGLVRGWVNQTAPNYGLMLRAPESAGNDFAFFAVATRSWSGYEPYLTLAYGTTALDGAAPADQAAAPTCAQQSDLARCFEPGAPAR